MSVHPITGVAVLVSGLPNRREGVYTPMGVDRKKAMQAQTIIRFHGCLHVGRWEDTTGKAVSVTLTWRLTNLLPSERTARLIPGRLACQKYGSGDSTGI
jgi:hypothetical protein